MAGLDQLTDEEGNTITNVIDDAGRSTPPAATSTHGWLTSTSSPTKNGASSPTSSTPW
jgi:hypothetical protein